MAGLIARLWAIVRSKELAGRDKTGNVFYRQSINVDGAGIRVYEYRLIIFLLHFLKRSSIFCVQRAFCSV